jgi:hypothetical protein
MMDPNAMWRLLCETLRELHALQGRLDDREVRTTAIALFEALTTWLRRGGFPPTIE